MERGVRRHSSRHPIRLGCRSDDVGWKRGWLASRLRRIAGRDRPEPQWRDMPALILIVVAPAVARAIAPAVLRRGADTGAP
jgi:hypothetical protein